jgi:hypothetical protein
VKSNRHQDTANRINPVRIETVTHSGNDGVSITNNIFLPSTDPRVDMPDTAGVRHTCLKIASILQGLNLHAITIDEIWKCICQQDGYGPFSWQSILVKLDIPEEKMQPLLLVMVCASNERCK